MEALEIAWNHECSSSSRTEHAGQQPVGRNTTPTHVDLRDKPACLTDFLTTQSNSAARGRHLYLCYDDCQDIHDGKRPDASFACIRSKKTRNWCLFRWEK
ncbi:hypothetical protein FALCPG4_006451 [Fusarium falciforme]